LGEQVVGQGSLPVAPAGGDEWLVGERIDGDVVASGQVMVGWDGEQNLLADEVGSVQ